MEFGASPGQAGALAQISALAHGLEAQHFGVVSLAVLPEASLYRLLPESVRRLHGDILARIRAQLREEDQVHTTDGWEWLIVLPDLRSHATLQLAMLKLRRAFDGLTLTVDGVRLKIAIACGGAVHPDDGEDAHHLLQSARIARLNAERQACGYLAYAREMDHLDSRFLALEGELLEGFSSEQGLRLHLQPQIDAASRRCYGAEALLRWTRRSGEVVPPMILLAAIERLGLRRRFNRWLFQNACRALASLAESGVRIRLSINMGANDLIDPEIPDLLSQALDVWSLSPSAVVLEITETSMVEETEVVRSVLERLRELGAGLSIDDFGTGFSGMSYLRTLPVQEIKVDQSFVLNIADSERDREIVASIVSLARRLDLRVTAEGVETEVAASIVTALGCHGLQGYLFSPALPFEEFVAWYRARRTP